MKCISCGGMAEQNTMEYIHKTDNQIIIIENIPCEKCTQCGEEYLSDYVAGHIEKFIDTVKCGTDELTVISFDYKEPDTINKYKCVKCDKQKGV